MKEGPIKSYRDLRVWQLAMDLAVDVYEVTKAFPREEAFGLTSQARRAAVSVAANLAEGYGRDSGGAFAQFLKTAQGSLKELEMHLLSGQRAGLVGAEASGLLLNRCADVGKMLGSLIRKVVRS